MHAVVQARREQKMPIEFSNVEFIGELGACHPSLPPAPPVVEGKSASPYTPRHSCWSRKPLTPVARQIHWHQTRRWGNPERVLLGERHDLEPAGGRNRNPDQHNIKRLVREIQMLSVVIKK